MWPGGHIASGNSQKSAHIRRLRWKWNLLGVYESRRDIFVKHDRGGSLQPFAGATRGYRIPALAVSGQMLRSEENEASVGRAGLEGPDALVWWYGQCEHS